MGLTVHVESATIVFRSAGYFLRIFGRRFRLSSWVTPGNLTVIHAEAGTQAFRFTLEITHPPFGQLIRLSARFREVWP